MRAVGEIDAPGGLAPLVEPGASPEASRRSFAASVAGAIAGHALVVGALTVTLDPRLIGIDGEVSEPISVELVDDRALRRRDPPLEPAQQGPVAAPGGPAAPGSEPAAPRPGPQPGPAPQPGPEPATAEIVVADLVRRLERSPGAAAGDAPPAAGEQQGEPADASAAVGTGQDGADAQSGADPARGRLRNAFDRAVVAALSDLGRHIDRNMQNSPPPAAGRVVIRLTIGTDGAAEGVRIAVSSGNSALDARAVADVANFRFPTPPQSLSAVLRTYRLPITYAEEKR